MEKIRKMQIADNKENKFFCFPMNSMPCTGSGYKEKELSICKSNIWLFSFYVYVPNLFPYSLGNAKSSGIYCLL